MAAVPPLRLVGKVVGGRYQLLELIGRGGQATVYRAKDSRDGDEVAIKILNQDLSVDSDYRERMMREAQALAALQSTAAVHVLDQCWTENRCLCLVTEFLHGRDLEAFLQAEEAKSAWVPPALVTGLLGPIAETLAAAHSIGIVHRDLKPGNIFVQDTAFGRKARLLDFGYAKFLRSPSFTAQGTVAGSPSYIAPEAWAGRPALLDHRLDVYGLGAVIFRCLARRPVFEANSLAELLTLATTAERPSLHTVRPDLPPRIDDWVRAALAIDPGERFSNVAALWRAFTSLWA
jgi:eukaryotic-like serine/threonine-protein kinase